VACADSTCVEAAALVDAVMLRTTRRPDAILLVARDEWSAFIAAVKRGEFDSL
jgi:hypothetical protein